LPDPNREEIEKILFARAVKIHPGLAKDMELSPETSRFRA
jgi:hypothetical protein